jgi:hypothetical protein
MPPRRRAPPPLRQAALALSLLVHLGCSRWTPAPAWVYDDVPVSWDVRADVAPVDVASDTMDAEVRTDIPSSPDGCAPTYLNYCGDPRFPCTCGTCSPWGGEGRDLCVTAPARICTVRLAATGACAVGEVCLATSNSMGGLCVPSRACVMFANIDPEARCWHTDDTIARVGGLLAATCQGTGFTPCGQGCPSCPEGRVCAWASERSPTGVCIPRLRRDRIVTCTPTENPLLCQPGEVCLLPTRDPAVGIPDAQRIGACVPRDECLAVRAALPNQYLCRGPLGP